MQFSRYSILSFANNSDEENGVRAGYCLTLAETKLFLGAPDSSTQKVLRDLAVLALLYNSGCRVEEFTKIKIGDIDFSAMTLALVGKWRKHRTTLHLLCSVFTSIIPPMIYLCV